MMGLGGGVLVVIWGTMVLSLNLIKSFIEPCYCNK